MITDQNLLKALRRDRYDPQYQRVRDRLETVLPFDLADYEGQKIKITGYDRDHVPETFEVWGADNQHCEITINNRDENLDWLAWHVWCAWLRNCT